MTCGTKPKKKNNLSMTNTCCMGIEKRTLSVLRLTNFVQTLAIYRTSEETRGIHLQRTATSDNPWCEN